MDYIKYFECTYCHIPFLTIDLLNEHLSLYHEKIGEGKDAYYLCQFCPKVFKSRQTRNWNNNRWHSSQLKERIADAYQTMGMLHNSTPQNKDVACTSGCGETSQLLIQTPKGVFQPQALNHQSDLGHMVTDQTEEAASQELSTLRDESPKAPPSTTSSLSSNPIIAVTESTSLVLKAFGGADDHDFCENQSVDPNQIMGCTQSHCHQHNTTDNIIETTSNQPIPTAEKLVVSPNVVDKTVIPTERLQALLIAAIGLYQADWDVADTIVSNTTSGYDTMKAGLLANWTIGDEME